MKPAIAVIALSLAFGSAAAEHEPLSEPPDGMVGLLQLPMLFGTGACSRFQPKRVQLFSEPRANRPLGHIRVTKPWVFAEDGGCSGHEVGVFLGTQPAEPLPTLEYDYEAPAAIVLAKSGPWCQVMLQSRAAWINKECLPGFLSVQELLRDKMLYLRPGALALAKQAPQGTAFKPPPMWISAEQVSVSLMASKIIQGEIWLHLSASHINTCEADPKPEEVERFWLPLRDTNGALQVWYYARGC